MAWMKYKKTAEQEMRPYVPGEDLTGVSVSERDTPEQGGMIARGANDGALWYVSEIFHKENYEIAGRFCCSSEKFVAHIQQHLKYGEPVICKICGKTIDEIANLSLDPSADK